jgi:glycosyltransferase involved in cell wall biosynthesis
MLARAFAAGGHDVTVVSLGPATGSWIERDLADQRVTVRFLDKRPGLDVRVVPRLARVLRAARPDVVHTHLHVLKYLTPTRPLWRGPIVHTLHNVASREAERSDLALQRVLFRSGVAAVAIGDEVARSVVEVYGRPARATIPNGIPVAAMVAAPDARAAVRAELHAPDGAPVIVAVGRLDAQKNHALLVEAMADPRLRALGARLWIAGDGPARGALRTQAALLGVEDQVTLLGVRGDVPRLLAAADAFVLSSDWEGNPLVVMEAMAAGLPVVATAVGCVPELVTPECGRLVRAGDAAGLAAALREVLADPAARARMGQASGARARSRFDLPVMASAYLDLFGALRGGA